MSCLSHKWSTVQIAGRTPAICTVNHLPGLVMGSRVLTTQHFACEECCLTPPPCHRHVTNVFVSVVSISYVSALIPAPRHSLKTDPSLPSPISSKTTKSRVSLKTIHPRDISSNPEISGTAGESTQYPYSPLQALALIWQFISWLLIYVTISCLPLPWWPHSFTKMPFKFSKLSNPCNSGTLAAFASYILPWTS